MSRGSPSERVCDFVTAGPADIDRAVALVGVVRRDGARDDLALRRAARELGGARARRRVGGLAEAPARRRWSAATSAAAGVSAGVAGEHAAGDADAGRGGRQAGQRDAGAQRAARARARPCACRGRGAWGRTSQSWGTEECSRVDDRGCAVETRHGRSRTAGRGSRGCPWPDLLVEKVTKRSRPTMHEARGGVQTERPN